MYNEGPTYTSIILVKSKVHLVARDEGVKGVSRIGSNIVRLLAAIVTLEGKALLVGVG
jgi:hypothetical protein